MLSSVHFRYLNLQEKKKKFAGFDGGFDYELRGGFGIYMGPKAGKDQINE